MGRVVTPSVWNKLSLLRLASGLILAFGLSNLAGLLLQPASSEEGRISPVGFLTATLILHLGGLWALSVFLREHGVRWNEFLSHPEARAGRRITLGALAGLASIPLLGTLGSLSTWALKLLGREPQLQKPLAILESIQHPAVLILFGFTAVVTAPVFEELLFRGILFQSLDQAGWKRGAWWLSAAAFGLIHFDYEKFLPLAVFGLILTWLAVSTRTLLAPIAAHVAFNLTNFILFINRDGLEKLKP
ncbi:MAG: CPBP family intramembrane metalloprotease [Verrucomicrobia bacterium]|nr:CPBP family intramembrane metalloprotease [Verrucomicrobiota bacterium]